MKRRYRGTDAAVMVWAVAAALGVASCGTEEPGTNGPSEEYFPASVGHTWRYDTYNLTRDAGKAHPFYTLVSVRNVVAVRGLAPEPVFVTNYAKSPDGQRLRLNQASFYWPNKDLFFKYEYFTYGTDRFLLRGYHYLNEWEEPIIGTFFYDGPEGKTPFTLFKTPFELNAKWDVLNYGNPDPENNPTVFRNVDQKDYFGLPRDMDGDGQLDTMDISIIGTVAGNALIKTDLETLNCYVVVLTQNLVFHLSRRGDVQDVSKTTYWIAPKYGAAKIVWYQGSKYLDNIEMNLRTWWFIK
ncbi:MAG: hypothetical protein GTN49_05390 [candidate division Zixibacteria bacterium]|nr:hypothetical protein [candidate division Zixibacteria bacterium]